MQNHDFSYLGVYHWSSFSTALSCLYYIPRRTCEDLLKSGGSMCWSELYIWAIHWQWSVEGPRKLRDFENAFVHFSATSHFASMQFCFGMH